MGRNRKPAEVPEEVKQAIRQELREPQLAELATFFFAQAGGMEAVAKMLYLEFLSARQGSLIRQRILDMILRCVRYANDQNQGTDDLGLANEEDLEAMAAALLKKHRYHVKPAKTQVEPADAGGTASGVGPTEPDPAPAPWPPGDDPGFLRSDAD